jgi:hypothetical protein
MLKKPKFPGQLVELENAKKLLKQAGFTVSKPKPKVKPKKK